MKNYKKLQRYKLWEKNSSKSYRRSKHNVQCSTDVFQKGEREHRKETIITLKIKDNFPVSKRFQTEKAHWVGMEGNKIKTHSHNFKIPED